MPERYLNFEEIINRKNTRCLKYDFAKKRGYPEDVLPLWVADMDFRTTSYVEDAIIEAARHNIYGYTNTQDGDGFFEAVAGWMKQRHHWEVAPQWHVKTPGVCFAIATAIQAMTDPGDVVLIQEPVYYPFRSAILENGRRAVSSDLLCDGQGHYTIDFDDFERKAQDQRAKLLILCNPHNPVGRVWSREELKRLGDICKAHDVVVFSDEIHFDFIWKGSHTIFQEVEESFREFTITATAPSKSFNLAGLQQSNIFIPNEDIRKRFERVISSNGVDEPNTFGIAATVAAYTNGGEWFDAVHAYIEENIHFAGKFVEEHLPGVRMSEPEGTYLLWLDFRNTGLDSDELEDLIVRKAGLWLDSGRIFGKPGQGFQRINAACPRSVLNEALIRIRDAL